MLSKYKVLSNSLRQEAAYGDSYGYLIIELGDATKEEIEELKKFIKEEYDMRIWNEYNLIGIRETFKVSSGKSYKGNLLVYRRYGHYTG